MLLAIFVVSVLVLEAILRHDEVVERKRKEHSAPQFPPANGSVPDTAGVLILAQAIEQHSKEAKQPSRTSLPSYVVSSPDPSLQEASDR